MISVNILAKLRNNFSTSFEHRCLENFDQQFLMALNPTKSSEQDGVSITFTDSQVAHPEAVLGVDFLP